MITYEALGLCPEGGAEKFIADGDNTYGGRIVTNPSGGLLSKGHPLGATGLAQCEELTRQLRGRREAPAGRGRADRPAAQSRTGRRLRRHAVPARLRPTWSINPPSGVSSAGHRAASSQGDCACSPRRSARPTRCTATRRAARAAGYAGDAGAADIPVLPGDDRPDAARDPRAARHRSGAACCTASSASSITRRSWSATP